MYEDVLRVIEAGGFDLSDLLRRIDVLYIGGRINDDERESLQDAARSKAAPDDQLPSLTERVGALEIRVAALEQGTYEPPAVSDEWPAYVKPTSKDEYYSKGDQVTFEDEHYICNKNNVVSSPTEDPKSWVKA